MRKTVVVVTCDRCGTEITDDLIPTLVMDQTDRNSGITKDPKAGERYELCLSCVRDIQMLLAGEPETSGTAEPETPPKQKKQFRKTQRDLNLTSVR